MYSYYAIAEKEYIWCDKLIIYLYLKFLASRRSSYLKQTIRRAIRPSRIFSRHWEADLLGVLSKQDKSGRPCRLPQEQSKPCREKMREVPDQRAPTFTRPFVFLAFIWNTTSFPCASTMTESPFLISPEIIFCAIGSRTCVWIARFSGRAPYCAS